MTVPPFAFGAVHTSETPPTVSEGVGAAGALGEPRRVIDGETSEGSDTPAAFVAVTVNVYGIPRLRPVMVRGDADPVTVAPLDAVTV